MSARLCIASQIAAALAHKLLPHGVTQNLTDRRIQAKQIASDALDIAERLIELDAERESVELQKWNAKPAKEPAR